MLFKQLVERTLYPQVRPLKHQTQVVYVEVKIRDGGQPTDANEGDWKILLTYIHSDLS